MHNVTEAFKAAMLDNGITPPPCLIGDSNLHRFYVEGDRAGTKNGAYTLHMDARPSGWAMHYKTGVSFTWTASGKREAIPNAMLQQIQYARQVRQQEQAKAHQLAAEKANQIWIGATYMQVEHPYLAKKLVLPHGIRVSMGNLLVPIFDGRTSLVNLQFIRSNGDKRFLAGAKKKGCFSTIGKLTDTILICEGWATGASLHESTWNYVVVALDAGNLKPVAEAVRRLYPNAEIIICGDNDLSGVGRSKAREAALACGGKVLIPPLVGTDFNDFINAGGVVYG